MTVPPIVLEERLRKATERLRDARLRVRSCHTSSSSPVPDRATPIAGSPGRRGAKPSTLAPRKRSTRHKIFDRIDDAVRWLEAMGFTVVQAGSGHLKVYHRERMVGVISKNMNDARGWKNAMRYISRESGVVMK